MNRGFWSKLFQPAPVSGQAKFTFEELQNLYGVLQRNPVVTEANRAIVVETIRSIAEFIIWGDQNEPSIFDFFLENNVMLYLHRVLQQPANRTGDVAKQVLQTLSIIVQNIRSETGIYFLFSNNHINNIVELRFDFEDEEVLGYYVSFLKTISLKLNPSTVQFFFDSREGAVTFPLYAEAIKMAHHKEGMVRAGVRTLTLNVFSVDNSNIQTFITQPPATAYFYEMANYVADQIKILDARLHSAESYGQQALSSLDSQIAEVEDMLAYCADILTTGSPALAPIVAHQLWATLVGPLLLRPLMEIGAAQRMAKEGKDTLCPLEDTPASKTVRPACALYVLERCFHIFAYAPFLHNLLLALLGGGGNGSDGASAGVCGPLPSDPLKASSSQRSAAAWAVGLQPCRAAVLAVLASGHPRAVPAALRMLVAATTNRHVAPEVLQTVGLLPLARCAQLRDVCRAGGCAACLLDEGQQRTALLLRRQQQRRSQSGDGSGRDDGGRDGGPACTFVRHVAFPYLDMWDSGAHNQQMSREERAEVLRNAYESDAAGGGGSGGSDERTPANDHSQASTPHAPPPPPPPPAAPAPPPSSSTPHPLGLHPPGPDDEADDHEPGPLDRMEPPEAIRAADREPDSPVPSAATTTAAAAAADAASTSCLDEVGPVSSMQVEPAASAPYPDDFTDASEIGTVVGSMLVEAPSEVAPSEIEALEVDVSDAIAASDAATLEAEGEGGGAEPPEIPLDVAEPNFLLSDVDVMAGVASAAGKGERAPAVAEVQADEGSEHDHDDAGVVHPQDATQGLSCDVASMAAPNTGTSPRHGEEPGVATVVSDADAGAAAVSSPGATAVGRLVDGGRQDAAGTSAATSDVPPSATTRAAAPLLEMRPAANDAGAAASSPADTVNSASTNPASSQPFVDAMRSAAPQQSSADSSDDTASPPLVDDPLRQPATTAALSPALPPPPVAVAPPLPPPPAELCPHHRSAFNVADAADASSSSPSASSAPLPTTTAATAEWAAALFPLLTFSLLPITGLWHLGHLLHRLMPPLQSSPLPTSQKEATGQASTSEASVVAGEPTSTRGGAKAGGDQAEVEHMRRAALRAALSAAVAGVLEELGHMWCEAIFPLLCLEWPVAAAGMARPALRTVSDLLVGGPALYPKNRAKINMTTPQKVEMGLSSSAISALHTYHNVQRLVAVIQICQLMGGGTVDKQAPLPLMDDMEARLMDVNENQQCELSPGSAIPCIVSFAAGQERKVYFAVAGAALTHLGEYGEALARGDAGDAAVAAAIMHTSPAVVLADPAPTRLNAGIVLSVSPLLGCDPIVDAGVAKWLHVHVRPSVRGLLRVLRTAPAKKGGVLVAMRQLADGHWVLAFPDAERAANARTLVEQSVHKLRAVYCEMLNPVLALAAHI